MNLHSQDDRSPLSSGESSDESSSVEVAGPSHQIQEQIIRRQRQPQSQPQSQPSQQQQQQQSISANKKQVSQTLPQPIQVRDDLSKNFGNSGNLNSLLYPSAFVNLPQDVLMNLVQSGRLQVEEEGKNFAEIPFDFIKNLNVVIYLSLHHSRSLYFSSLHLHTNTSSIHCTCHLYIDRDSFTEFYIFYMVFRSKLSVLSARLSQ